MRVPQELEGLLWELAENPDPAALDEFGERYPELRSELGRRIATVRGLRGARPTEVRPPAFRPRPPAKPVWRPIPVLASLFGLLALGTAGYWIGEQFAPRTPVAPKAPVIAKVDPPALERPTIVYEVPPVTVPQVEQRQPETPPAPTVSDLYERKATTLAVTEASLQSAIQLVAGNVGMKVIFAPGMPNPTVSTDYRGQSALQILQDLGNEYKFTVFDQGDGTLLAIPAVAGSSTGETPGADPVLTDTAKGN